jgi:hypothetical protein
MKQIETFHLPKSLFHQLNLVTHSTDKVFDFKVCAGHFFFSLEQILFLSNMAFKLFFKNVFFFKILLPQIKIT